jgi:DNA polymerase V
MNTKTSKPFRINRSSINLPVYSGVSAGFPSPANDYLDSAIDLNKELIKNPSSTFFARVKGFSMIDAGIEEDDLLIVDKSIKPQNGMVAVCFVDGEFTLKEILIGKNSVTLFPANNNYQPLVITENNDFQIWGIVTYVIKKIL